MSYWTIGNSFATKPIIIFLSYGASLLSYVFIEQPFQNNNVNFFRKRPIVSILLAYTASIIIVALIKGSHLYLGAQDTRKSGDAPFGDITVDFNRANCHTKIPDKYHCQLIGWGKNSSKTIYSVGDSHALALNGLLYSLSNNFGYTVFSTSVSATPMPAVDDKNQLGHLQNQIFSFLKDNVKAGDVIIVSNVLQDYLTSEKLSSYFSKLDNFVKTFEDLDVEIILFYPIPRYPSISHGNACTNQWFQIGCTINLKDLNNRDDLENQRKAAADLYRAFENHKNVLYFDPFEYFCLIEQKSCSTYIQNVSIFYDNTHINNEVSSYLAVLIDGVIKKEALLEPKIWQQLMISAAK